MEDTQIRRLGDELYDALRQRRTLVPLTDRHPDISIDDAQIRVTLSRRPASCKPRDRWLEQQQAQACCGPATSASAKCCA